MAALQHSLRPGKFLSVAREIGHLMIRTWLIGRELHFPKCFLSYYVFISIIVGKKLNLTDFEGIWLFYLWLYEYLFRLFCLWRKTSKWKK